MRVDQTTAARGETPEQFGARAIGQTEMAPARAVAIDRDAAVAGVGPAGRAMRDGIDEAMNQFNGLDLAAPIA